MTPLKHLFVMDRLTSINPAKDTTFAFLDETQTRAHENYVCSVADLTARGARGSARALRLKVARTPPHFDAGDAHEIAFDDVDVIWMRKDPPVDETYLFATMLLERVDPRRTLVLNDP